MADDPSVQSLAGQLADELNDCRQRGLADLDMRTHNQEPVPAELTTGLARRYCEARGLQLYGRTAQITKLIEDGLDVYASQGNEQTRAAKEADQQLITTLYFDPLVTAPTNGPNLAQEKARNDLKMTADEFGRHRRRVFLRFASFLIPFVDEVAPERTERAVQDVEPERTPPPLPPPRDRLPLVWITGAVAALFIIGGVVTAVVLTHSNGGQAGPPSSSPVAQTPTPTSPPFVASKTYTEQSGGYGSPTFTDAHSPAISGPKVPPYQMVKVACKVLAPTIPSASPDGYWYRLSGGTWDGDYAVANTFLNGDPVKGPFKHPTDWNVPDCPS